MIYKLGTAVAAGAAAALLFSGAAGASAFEPDPGAASPAAGPCQDDAGAQSGDAPAAGANGKKKQGTQPSGTSDPLNGLLDSGSAKAPITQPNGDNGDDGANGDHDANGAVTPQECEGRTGNGNGNGNGGDSSTTTSPNGTTPSPNGAAPQSDGAGKNNKGKKAE
ncbi:hypothetical protein [Nocardia brasiliensis]|uniref:hypothetical protein n=1 Tax=Nocardia brasiliensis TaxID=37326 RepID=UPI002457E0AC|nr:hypothetical protein [Nocardia brasiliensis]